MADNDLSNTLSALFSNPESMSKLQGLIGMLSSGNGGENQQAQSAQQEPTAAPAQPVAQQPAQSDSQASSGGIGGLPFDPGLLVKLQQAMSLVRQDDPRVAFLIALKPNLSDRRRQRIDEAVRMLRLVHLVPFLREQHFL